MTSEYPYLTILDAKYKPLELIEEKRTADEAPHPWYNETLCQVNDSVVRLGIVKGSYHWHQHDREDEFFYVVEGMLHIDLIDGDDPASTEENPRTISLGPRQGVVVPKGVRHRPRAPERTVMLMVETDTIRPTGS
jgi:mannose-6-phosphate isomerase-like protein (cupin superfamily)